MIWHALHTLASVPAIERVFVVLAPGDAYWSPETFGELGDKITVLHCGGATRARSVCNGLRAIEREFRDAGLDADTRVLVHDAARPCLSGALVERLIAEVGVSEAGGLLAMPVADTLKRVTESNPARVAATVARDGLWQAQTPQLFPLGRLLDALEFAPEVTDEASAIEALGLLPRLVESESTNFKVTYPRDLALAELILCARATTPD